MTGYLKAKDMLAISAPGATPQKYVEPDTPAVDLLPLLLDAPGRLLGVSDSHEMLGVITESSLLEGLGRMISPRDDSSLVSVECRSEDYSAATLAQAIEDSGAHLVDLWTAPTDHDTMLVTLRVRNTDPSSAVHHLERYGFDVTDASGASYMDADTAMERMRAIERFINI